MKIYFSLGANIGDREANLQHAIDLLSERVGEFVACSAFHETPPLGFESENLFLNCVCCFEVETTKPGGKIPRLAGKTSRLRGKIPRLGEKIPKPGEKSPSLGISSSACENQNSSLEDLLSITEGIERELGRTQKSLAGQHFDRPIDIDMLFADDIVLLTPRLTLPHPRLHERRFVLEPLAEIAPGFIHPLLKISVEDMLNKLNTSETSDTGAQIERVAEATPEIAEAVAHLLAQISSTPHDFTLLHLAALVRTPLTHLFILRDEAEKICAMATLCITQTPTGCKAWIEDVVVGSECRGRGYGRRLIEHLTATAFAMKADAVMLTSRPSRIAANALYRSTGFSQKETNVYVKKK